MDLLFLTLVSYQLLVLLLQFHYSVSAADEDWRAWYKPGCQKQVFNCGQFIGLRFPYTKEPILTCAPGRLDCSGAYPKLSVLGSLFYDVKRFPTEETVEVNYPPLNTLKSSNSCEIFNYYNISFPNSGAVSFTFTPNITLFKCYKPPPYNNNSTIGIQNCGSYKIYYSRKKGVELLTDLQTPPPHCQIITLPAAPDDARWATSGDLFSQLASEFTIRFRVSTQCQDCIRIDKRCFFNQPDFSCMQGYRFEDAKSWYKPGCQQQVFNCGMFGEFKFPFTNETSPTCAPGRLDCSGDYPKLNLGSLVYEVKRYPTEETVEVNSPPLTNLKSIRSCEILDYDISFPNSVAVSFTVTSNITLLKCYEPLPYNNTMIGIQNCGDYRIYYSRKKGVELVTDLQNPPPYCEIITLPAAPDDARWASNGDLFSQLASEFTIRFHVSTQYQDCINKGNRYSLQPWFSCMTDHKGFISGTRKKVVAAAVVSAVGILPVLSFCYLWRYFTGKQNKIHRNVEAILKNNRQLAPNRYSYANMRKMTKSFSEKLSQGGYGQVYKGKLRNGTLVAVKILKETKGNGEEFMNEVTSISRTSHINIVPLLGYCYKGRKRALIYEFMPNGSLDKFLHNKAHHLGLEKLHQISLGIAQGLEYLHRGCNTRILHLDIKPQNILLDEEFRPKISDFGLAKLCHNKESIVSLLDARGTIGYIAPEVFCRQYGGVSHKSDVYSYGMMVLDMVEPKKNIAEEINEGSEMYFPDMIYRRLELIDQDIGEVDGIKNAEEKEIARMMMIVGLWCIQTEPSSRPAMSEVVDMLKGTVESLPIPSRPILTSIPRELANSSKADYMSSSSVHLVE